MSMQTKTVRSYSHRFDSLKILFNYFEFMIEDEIQYAIALTRKNNCITIIKRSKHALQFLICTSKNYKVITNYSKYTNMRAIRFTVFYDLFFHLFRFVFLLNIYFLKVVFRKSNLSEVNYKLFVRNKNLPEVK